MTRAPRHIALDILNRIEKEGGHADEHLKRWYRAIPQLSSREKAFVLELVYGVLRRRNSLDWIIGQFSSEPERRTSRQVGNLLRIGVYQVLYLTHIPIPVSVSATVQLAKSFTNERIAARVNGVLRNVVRNREHLDFPSLADNPAHAISVQYSHPLWVVELWLQQLGLQETIALCEANNIPPPFIIRTNTLKVTRKQLIHALKQEGIIGEATSHSPEGIVLSHPADVTRLSSFEAGWFFIQDEAAQLVSHLVNPAPGDRVLELCAAPGGKTTHLAQLMQNRGCIVAVDVGIKKLSLLRENQNRLGIRIALPVLADASRSLPLKSDLRFDKVLVDAPCSGLGILRRHPEGKWTKSPELISQLKAIQLRLLLQASELVTPGGVMVYSTCTISAEENKDRVREFLVQTPHHCEVENPVPFLPFHGGPPIESGGYVQTLPHRHCMDGFFSVRIRRVG